MVRNASGFALITVLMFMVILAAMFAAYTSITRTEVLSLHASKDSFSGFNAAEAGVNLRADIIKNEFRNYNRPSGVSPVSEAACADEATAGSGDFACRKFDLASKHEATTYVVENPGNPSNIVIPHGEPFSGLTASEYRFTVTSVAENVAKNKEAKVELMFKTRLVPLFQFLVFFNDDLELVEGGHIELGGILHSNKDIYLAQQSAYWIPDALTYMKGPVSAAGSMYRGAKFQTSCSGGSGGWSGGWYYDILINDLSTYRALPSCSGNRRKITKEELVPFNANALDDVPELTVPDVNTFKSFASPDPDQPNTFTYWDRADARFVLRLQNTGLPKTTNAATGIEVTDRAGNVMVAATSKLNNATLCPGLHVTGGGAGRAVGAKGNWSTTAPYTTDARFRLFRDYQHYPAMNNFETVLDVDVRALLNCMHKYHSDFLENGHDIDETTDGGLVFFFAIDGPNSDLAQNNYAVRFNNGAVLQSNIAGAPLVKGLTMVTDQKSVLWGHYNKDDATWIPSAIMSDSQDILSENWTDAKSNTAQSWTNRFTDVTTLTQQVAILTGAMPSCGGNGVTCEGSMNDFGGGYTGVFRFNETFYDGTSTSNTHYIQQPMKWVGSIVSLSPPAHNQTLLGPFNYFSSPSYDYKYDVRFNDPDKLPPLTPRAVYNKQELFERAYD